ncbi:MAG: MATE family efflux transporter [Campylobacteraceae bacterium]|jgi:putative MATE family efflux protein|nr:MATE family efflux transporter [Campylobacteraceae bacterium]
MEKNNLAKNFNAKTLFLFALPTMTMMLFESLYSIVDGIFVARFVNIDAFASINIVMPAILFFMGTGTMFGVGGSAIIAKKMGEKKYNEANSDFSVITLVLLAISLVDILIGAIFMDEILEWLGATDILMPYAKSYFQIILFGLLVFMGQFLFQSFFIVAGEPKMGLAAVLSAGFANIILDYIFIVWFDMGIEGAAYGTVISSAIPTIIGIIFFFNKKKTLHFTIPKWSFAIITQSSMNGSSALVNFLAGGVIAFLFNQAMLKLLGELGIAAATIIAYTEYVFNSLFFGYCVGIAPIISFNYGAKERQKIEYLLKKGAITVIVLSILTVLMMLLFSSDIVRIFSQDNIALYNIALIGFIIFAFKYLLSGINILISVLFTSFSKGKISALIAIIRTFGLIVPIVLLLPTYIGVYGVWLAIPMAEFVIFFISIFLFSKIIKVRKIVTDL